MSLGLYVAHLAAVLSAVLLLVDFPVERPEYAPGRPVVAGSPDRCVVLRDASGESEWWSIDTLRLRSTTAVLPDTSWRAVHEADGYYRPLLAWRSVRGDSVEVTGHHLPRLRFAWKPESGVRETSAWSRTLLQHVVQSARSANPTAGTVLVIPCPRDEWASAS